MIYFDPTELAISCLYSFIFGILVAGIYASLYKIITYVILFLRLPIDALIARSGIVSVQSIKTKVPLGRLNLEIFDFIFFTLTGAAYILLLYVSLDGIPRIHFFILSLFGFVLSRATMGSFFTAAFDIVLSRLYMLFYLLLYVFLTPARYISRIIGKLMSLIAHRIRKIIISYKYRRLLRLKIKNTKRLMNKLCNPANIFF